MISIQKKFPVKKVILSSSSIPSQKELSEKRENLRPKTKRLFISNKRSPLEMKSHSICTKNGSTLISLKF